MSIIKKITSKEVLTKEEWWQCERCGREEPKPLNWVTSSSGPKAFWLKQEVYGPPDNTVLLCPTCRLLSTTMCNHEPKHMLWKAQTGPVYVCQMTDSHLENAMLFMQRVIDEKSVHVEDARKRFVEVRANMLKNVDNLENFKLESKRRAEPVRVVFFEGD